MIKKLKSGSLFLFCDHFRKFWLICVVMALNGALVAVIFVSLMPELKETAR